MAFLFAAAPQRLIYWITAVRPKTLTIAIAPVVVGAALAYLDRGNLLVDILLATLIGAILVQAGTNLHNDAADFDAGADRPGQRLGPPRAAAQGWLSAREVRLGAGVCFGLALLIGSYLIAAGGWPIAALGIASLLAGIGYSSGPHPISYSSLGELFVLLFFGLAAVGGTYYLQTGDINTKVLLAGIYVGTPASAVLIVNNHRDRVQDKRAGRRTLAIIFGETVTKIIYTALLTLPFALLPALDSREDFWWWLLLPLALWAVALIRRLWIEPIGTGLNTVLARTALLQLALCAALAAAWLLPLSAQRLL